MLNIAILNLMPMKEVTEADFIRLFKDVGLPVSIRWMRLRSHTPKHATQEHMDALYHYFDELAPWPIHGLIITGAPVEQIGFEDVTYWPELCCIMDWARHNAIPAICICWAAQAALYHFFHIPKHPLPTKRFGIYEQQVLQPENPLMAHLGGIIHVPHSRHTEVRREDIKAVTELQILADGQETGPSIIATSDGRTVFITGHIEYATDTLHNEFIRDQLRGRTDVLPPEHYYDADGLPVNTWQAMTAQFYKNWLNTM